MRLWLPAMALAAWVVLPAHAQEGGVTQGVEPEEALEASDPPEEDGEEARIPTEADPVPEAADPVPGVDPIPEAADPVPEAPGIPSTAQIVEEDGVRVIRLGEAVEEEAGADEAPAPEGPEAGPGAPEVQEALAGEQGPSEQETAAGEEETGAEAPEEEEARAGEQEAAAGEETAEAQDTREEALDQEDLDEEAARAEEEAAAAQEARAAALADALEDAEAQRAAEEALALEEAAPPPELDQPAEGSEDPELEDKYEALRAEVEDLGTQQSTLEDTTQDTQTQVEDLEQQFSAAEQARLPRFDHGAVLQAVVADLNSAAAVLQAGNPAVGDLVAGAQQNLLDVVLDAARLGRLSEASRAEEARRLLSFVPSALARQDLHDARMQVGRAAALASAAHQLASTTP